MPKYADKNFLKHLSEPTGLIREWLLTYNMHAVFTCPTTVGHSFAEILLFNIAFTAGSMLQISAYPPRMPHSPIYPLEQDINDANSIELYGSPIS